MSIRRVQLIIIDVLIYHISALMCLLLVTMNTSSLVVNGEFTFLKTTVLLFSILLWRLVARVYSSVWRYANVNTFMKLILADFFAGGLYILLSRRNSELNIGITCTVIIVMLNVILTILSRFIYQLMHKVRNWREEYLDIKSGTREAIHKINIAIIGGGTVGVSLAMDLLANPRSYYYPFCFIDKDANKIGGKINGIPVYREDADIVERIKDMPVQEVVIAIPDASAGERARLYNLYKETGCKVKVYEYPLGEVDGTNKKRELRELRIEDLLFRDTIKVSSDKTKDYYKNKTILVTGGGGSIGSELCRQIAELKPQKLVVIDIYENNAYDIQQELIRKFHNSLNLDVIIASIRDEKRMEEVFAEHRPNVVFHAAAHKHVPLMERNGCEAIKNNVFGTYNVANMSEKYGVERFVMISTDKAVNPTNIMGASKRLCEMIIQCRKDSKTEFTAVRFGNVLGSNGSVIPLFNKQIAEGGPITITDKRIIRYFMTISEAVGLVMEAGAMANNGELFVLDMGKPVRILELAENMIQLSGLKPYEDIDIIEVGLRPGEKLYEELLMKSEDLDTTSNSMIFIERDTAYTREEMENKLSILRLAVEMEGNDNIIDAIQKTVPTYCEPSVVNACAADAAEMNV